MAKQNNISLSDLKEKGLIEISPGVFQKVSKPQPRDIYVNKNTTMRKGPDLVIGKEMPSFIHGEEQALSPFANSHLTIDGIISGLNGDKGLMRAHWSETKRMKKIYAEIIRLHLKEGKIRKHEGKVSIRFVGYKSILMDWDNFASSFKHVGDALVAAKIIVDDKPSIVVAFTPVQIECKRTEQKVVVIIEDVK